MIDPAWPTTYCLLWTGGQILPKGDQSMWLLYDRTMFPLNAVAFCTKIWTIFRRVCSNIPTNVTTLTLSAFIQILFTRDRLTYAERHLMPPFLPPVWQAAGGCYAASALYASGTRLIPPRVSAFAREWNVHLWLRLSAARIRPPTPTSASWRKPSATHSDASRCCARDPAVSNVTLHHAFIHHPITFWVWKGLFWNQSADQAMQNVSCGSVRAVNWGKECNESLVNK